VAFVELRIEMTASAPSAPPDSTSVLERTLIRMAGFLIGNDLSIRPLSAKTAVIPRDVDL
jgi:hypothetical protein